MSWARLPEDVRDAVAARTGVVRAVRDHGRTGQVVAALETASGRLVVKARPAEGPRTAALARAEAVAPHVTPLGPARLWRTSAAGWHVAAFEHLPGHQADLRPGSADVPRTVAALVALGRMPCPDLPLPDARVRWGRLLPDPLAAGALGGGALLHAAPAGAHALLMGAAPARLVGWSGAMRGAPWIDAALLVVRLLSCDHGPAAAEHAVGPVPAWGTAPPGDVDAFAVALAREAAESPGAPDSDATAWRDATAAWAAHRARRAAQAAPSTRPGCA